MITTLSRFTVGARLFLSFVFLLGLSLHSCLVRKPPGENCAPGATRCNPDSGVAESCVSRGAWYPTIPSGEGTCPRSQRCCLTRDPFADAGADATADATLYACTAPSRCL